MEKPEALDTESADAKKVNQATTLIGGGNLDGAERILREVVANTPAEYVNSFEEGDTLYIKFWDHPEFLYYATRRKELGQGRKMAWIGNAYPRAHHYLGFIAIERKRYAEAIQWLDAGLALEPDHPHLWLEKAKALAFNGDREGALRLYEELLERGEEIASETRALALRGMGFQLIDDGLLDAAEQCFQNSLTLDPDSPVAKDELLYIQHLRSGGAQAPPELSMSTDLNRCRRCGGENATGRVITVEGRRTFGILCDRCVRNWDKKWWQFWR